MVTLSTLACGPQAEVQAPLVLGAEARAALHLLHLLLAVEMDASTRAPMALRLEQVMAGSLSEAQRPVRSNAIQSRPGATSLR